MLSVRKLKNSTSKCMERYLETIYQLNVFIFNINSTNSFFIKYLVEDLKSEVGGNFEKCLVAMLEPLAEFEAKLVRDAIKVQYMLLLHR